MGPADYLKFCPILTTSAGLIANHGEDEPTEISAVAECQVNESNAFEWVTMIEPIQTLDWTPPDIATHRFVLKLEQLKRDVSSIHQI